MENRNGFTLIELMIAVAIISILAAIGYPSYQDNVRKSRRADCEGALVGFAGAMERYFTTNNTYLGAGPSGANTGAPTIYSTQCPVDGGTATYNLTIQAATASTYTLQAAPVNAQTGDSCGTLTLNQANVKTASGGSVAECWQ
jgi:type IV pilus assembly protein PilE